jgi:uncharacterized protein YcbX
VSSVIVTELNIYPVKSLRGLTLAAMTLGSMGPDWDRRWMLVDHCGRFITQREEIRLCLMVVALEQGHLHLSAPQQTPISLPVDAVGQTCTVEVWDDRVDAVDCGDEVARWCTDFLQRDCRLVYMPDSCQRQVDPAYGRVGDTVSFADGFPLLLISQASLADLNRRLTTPVSMQRFRPNIVVNGCDAFAEDHWSAVKIGDLDFDLVKPCSRCVIPSINPETADKNPEVVRQLASYRRRAGKVYFGQNLIHREQGVISLGDYLTVVA